MAAYDTYAKCLIPKCHGYPLWEPDPGEYAPVELADVGYISEGSFVKLFNASLGPECRSNRLGFPAGHSPLVVGDIKRKSPLPKVPDYISSAGVSQKGADISLSAGYVILSKSSCG